MTHIISCFFFRISDDYPFAKIDPLPFPGIADKLQESLRKINHPMTERNIFWLILLTYGVKLTSRLLTQLTVNVLLITGNASLII